MKQVSLIYKTGRRLEKKKDVHLNEEDEGQGNNTIIKAYNLRLIPTGDGGEGSSQGGACPVFCQAERFMDI